MESSGKSQIKTFVIDTNVFIHKPDCVTSFRDNEVVIPLWVLEELDKLKTYSDERGRNARHAIRFLDNLGRRGSLSEGVKMDNGSTLRVVMSQNAEGPTDMLSDKADNKIIQMLVERDVEHGKRMADYSRKWGKPLLVTSNVARLAVRRGYAGLLEILGRKFVVYPTIEEAVRAYAAMADRHDFLQNNKSAGRSAEA